MKSLLTGHHSQRLPRNSLQRFAGRYPLLRAMSPDQAPAPLGRCAPVSRGASLSLLPWALTAGFFGVVHSRGKRSGLPSPSAAPGSEDCLLDCAVGAGGCPRAALT